MIAPALINQLIRGSGHLRRPGFADPAGRAVHKEWLHFCVTGEDLELIANFSLMGDTARVALIVRTGPGAWDGDIEPIDPDHVLTTRGSMDLDFGHNTLRYTDRGFELSIALSSRPITAELILEPLTIPLFRPNTQLSTGPMHWMVAPRLAASGRVIAGGKVFHLDNAPAYHDHNWGKFSWGDDFAWQWGFGLPARSDEKDPLALVLVRLIDRARTRDLDYALYFWRGAAQHRIFRDGEVTIRPRGFLKPSKVAKLPRVMALAAPELPTEAPEHVEIRAEGRGDSVLVDFEANDLVQVLVPNDRDLGVTAINELSGRYTVRGKIAGEPVHMDGRGYFELLTVSPGLKACAGAKSTPPQKRRRGFVELLRASLQILELEAPEIYAKLCAALAGRVVKISAGTESVTLGFSPNRALELAHVAPSIELATDDRTILALCDGELTLARAVLSDRVHLAGSTPDLIAFDDGLMIYLAGAVRAPSFVMLLHDYRVDAEKSAL